MLRKVDTSCISEDREIGSLLRLQRTEESCKFQQHFYLSCV